MKKKRLFDHFADATREHDGPCALDKKTKALRMCPTMAAVLGVHNEDDSRPGFELAPLFQMGTGKSLGPKLVYFTRRSEYVQVEHCPFCGNSVTSPPTRGGRK